MTIETSPMQARQDGASASRAGSRSNAIMFIFMGLGAVALIAVALIMGKAPLSGGLIVSDWLDWARIETTASGMLVLGVILFLVGGVGTAHSLMAPKADQRRAAPKGQKTPKPAAPVRRPTPPVDAVREEQAPEPAPPTVAPIAPHLITDNTRKASLRFEAAPVVVPKPVIEARPLATEAVIEAAAPPISAEIIPFRPEMAAEIAPEATAEPVAEPLAVSAEETHQTANDPIAAALLAETHEADPVAVPSSDINAVISSAMRFIETPDPAAQGVTSVAEVHAARTESEASDHPPLRIGEPDTVLSTAQYKALSEALGDPEGDALMDDVVLEAPIASSPEPVQTVAAMDPKTEIATALETALSQWPDSTRQIAEAELSTRINQLYYDNAISSREAFSLIKNGDLTAAADLIQTQAREWAAAELPAKAAEMWRIFGALHMGRDDDHAMMAYEQVSALDPTDGNIHLYLLRRYQMAEDTQKLPTVLVRALGVISDIETRSDLLTQYADLTQKAGNMSHTAQALEELSQIKAQQSAQAPDNLQLRSAHAISLARLAQVREQLGEFPKAGPLYQHAHQVFAELSARVPEHAGLKAMAENARRDAERLSA